MITLKTLFQADGLDDRSLEMLTKAIESNDLPGFDYLEFKRAVAALMQMNLDQPTAFKSAFTTAATMGLTKEKLLETAAYYRNIVEKESENFAKALESQQKAKITDREQEVKRLRDQIERHKSEIVRLQNELAQYLDQVANAETAIKADADRLAKTSTAFESAQKAVLLHIDRDIENIHKSV